MNTYRTNTLRLWEGGAPDAQGSGKLDIPTITIVEPPADKKTGASIVVCPGGGYAMLAEHEALPIAEWLASVGITGIVLKYRLGPRYRHPVPLGDAQQVIRTVRAHASEWGLDPQHIGILGFSAGGHLASTAATHFDTGDPTASDPIERASSRPDLVILIYPVITLSGPFAHDGSRETLLGKNAPAELVDFLSSEKQVTSDSPPAFLIHTSEDYVHCENSLLYALACRSAGVPVELHLYERGAHGFGLAAGHPILGAWPAACIAWLRTHGFASP